MSQLCEYIFPETSPDLGGFFLQNRSVLSLFAYIHEHADAHTMAQNDMLYRTPFQLEMRQQQQQKQLQQWRATSMNKAVIEKRKR